MSTPDPYAVFNEPGYWCGTTGSYRPDRQGVGYRDFVEINNIRAQYILSKKPQSVLDLGCGGNFLTARLRKWGVDAWGIDLSQYAKDHFCPPEVKDFFVVGNIADMSMFQDGQFDVAFSMGVLEHLTEADLERACREIKRVCRRGILAPCLSTELSANLPVEQRDPTHKVLRDYFWWRERFPPEFEIWEGADETWRWANQFKVLVISPSALPVGGTGYGGIERLAFLLSQELARRGIDTTLAAPDGSRTPWGVKLVETGFASMPAFLKQEALAFAILRPVVEGYSVILDLSHSHLVGRALPYHARSVSVIWHAPTLMQPEQPLYNVAALSKWQADNYFYYQGRRARVLDIHTLAQDALEIIKNRAAVGAKGSSTRPAPVEAPPDGPGERFLCVGKVNARKGVLEATEMCQEMEAGLDIIGPPGEDPQYNQAVLSRCRRGIQYWGELPQSTVLEMAARAKALLYPGMEPEAHSHKSVDVLGCGCPVVIWNRYAYPEVVEHGVDGFLANTREEFIEYMKQAERLDRALIRERAWIRWGPQAVGDRLVPVLTEASRGAR